MKIINGITLLVPLFFVSWQTGTSAEPANTTELAGETATEQAGDLPKPENSSLKSSGAKGQEKPTDISEKRQCYVFGQCQGYSVNFQQRSDAESCHMFCGKNEDCEWWSFEPSQSMCIAFENCTESGHPDSGACPDCISGERLCPARKCHDPTKCDGHFAGNFETAHLEDCIRGCNDNPSCSFYTFEKSNDHCLLYEDRGACEPCDTCASGEKRCSIGYHGTDSSAFMTPATSSEPETPSTTPSTTPRIDGTTPVCQIAQRIDGAFAECSQKCGQPLIASDYFSYSKNWKCYRDCGLPKLGYGPGHAGQTEAYNRLTMSAYWPAISDGFRADRRAYGDDADMGKSAVEFFAEKCEEAKYYLANYGVRR